MKKIFIIILGIIVLLSAYGIFDTMQKNKRDAEIQSKTVVFIAEIQNIEDVDGKSKFTIAGTIGSPGEFVGKKYSFVENDKMKVVNELGEESELSKFKEGDLIIIQHIGDIVEGDINELTGEITIAPKPEQSSETQPTEVVEPTK